MKILCLHGYGTSSSILKNQLDAFMRRADASYDFVFLDGEVECSKAKGLGNFVRGPFLCYNSNFAPSSVRASCELLDAVIEDQGPFDGVLGFSQGGSLALTYLLQHEIESPHDPPPFRFAILLSTVIAFSPDATFTADVFDNLTPADLAALQTFPSDISAFLHLQSTAASPAKKSTTIATLAQAFESAQRGGFIASDTVERATFTPGFDPTAVPRVMHPSLLPQRVRVPTVHVTGKADDPAMVELSKLMRGLCRADAMKCLEHAGAHDVPRDARGVGALVQAVEWAGRAGAW